MSSAEQQISRAFYELCALLLTILRSSPGSGPQQPRRHAVALSEWAPAARRNRLTPAAFASLLLGVSLALMLCGSVTFVIGFMLMPWVLGLVMLFYFVGIVSSLSGFGRAMLCPSSSTGSRTGPKEMPECLFSKVPIIRSGRKLTERLLKSMKANRTEKCHLIPEQRMPF